MISTLIAVLALAAGVAADSNDVKPLTDMFWIYIGVRALSHLICLARISFHLAYYHSFVLRALGPV